MGVALFPFLLLRADLPFHFPWWTLNQWAKWGRSVVDIEPVGQVGAVRGGH